MNQSRASIPQTKAEASVTCFTHCSTGHHRIYPGKSVSSESSQWLLHVAYYLLLTCNLRLCEALFGFLCRSHPPQLPTAVMKALNLYATAVWSAVHIALRARGRSIPPDNTARLSANDMAPSFGGSFTPEVDGFLRLS